MKDLPYQPYLSKITGNNGFIAALDQSGGSTPKALRLYGIAESEYSNEEEMFEKIHQMRTRIITSKSFTGDRILGAILFEKTMNGEIYGMDTAHYLWNKKKVVPFLKIEQLTSEQKVLLKLTIPNEVNLYAPFINHPNVLRVFALSGGYSREESNKLLALNNGMHASFSRALTEGLSAQQSDDEFNSVLDASIESIYQASIS